ncbi:MAG: hypothetical protein IJE48_05295 [Clostridia bacterium]|nr:hypothetical protein [Clostridia bacterium]
MENKELFQITAEGYNCAQVEQYITVLKTEYKKVFEYAKAVEANNEKLKKICRSLSDENKALKAGGAAPAAPVAAAPVAAAAPAAPAVDPALLASVDKIMKLSEEIAKENAVLRAKISK